MKISQNKLLERAGVYESPEVDETVVEIFAAHSRGQLDTLVSTRLGRFTKTKTIKFVGDESDWLEQLQYLGDQDPNMASTRVTISTVIGTVDLVKAKDVY